MTLGPPRTTAGIELVNNAAVLLFGIRIAANVKTSNKPSHIGSARINPIIRCAKAWQQNGCAGTGRWSRDHVR